MENEKRIAAAVALGFATCLGLYAYRKSTKTTTAADKDTIADKTVAAAVDQLLSEHLGRPVLVGVGGGSGSGKSTVVAHLIRHLKSHGISVTVLEQDAYYRDLSHLPIDQRAKSNFDHPDSIEFELFTKQLAELRQGKAISRPSYDFSVHSRRAAKDNVILAPAPVIIVDGILALHDPNLRELYDVMVFVNVSEEKRFERRAARDIVHRGRTRESVQKQFDETVAPMHRQFVEPSKAHAHVIVDWEHDDGHVQSGKGCEQVMVQVVPHVVDRVKKHKYKGTQPQPRSAL